MVVGLDARRDPGPPSEGPRARTPPARWPGTLALLVVLALPLPRWLAPGVGLAAQEPVFWAMTLVIVAYILRVERRPLASIGIVRPGGSTAALGVLGALAMVVGGAFIYLVAFPALGVRSADPGTSTLGALPVWVRVLVILRAATFEEIYFRGFAIERLTEILGSRPLAAALSLAVFAAEHASYWGWAHVAAAGFGGAVLTGLYLWRRDLGANMLAHLLTDAVGFLAG